MGARGPEEGSLPDAAHHLHLDETVELHRVLEGKLLRDGLDTDESEIRPIEPITTNMR